MFKALTRLLALFLALQPALALAQSAPATMPYHSVYGRIGAQPGDTGPGQAIPLPVLRENLGFPKTSVANTVLYFKDILGGLTSSPSFQFFPATNAATAAIVSNFSTGTNASAVWSATNANASASFGVGGANYATIPLLQNRAYVDAQVGLSGVAINSQSANPIIFSISNAEVGRFTGTAGFTLAPSYQTANVGKAAMLATVPNRANGLVPTYNGFVFAQGPPITAIKQGGQDLAGLQQTLVVSNSLAAGDSKAGIALAAYSESNCADPCNTIAIFGQAQGNVAGASIFGGNILAQNIADNNALGLDANYLAALELGPNKWKNVGGTDTTVNGNHFYGLNIQGGGNHTDEIGSAIVINNSAFPAPTRWANGVELIAGCCINGVSFGPAALGINQSSQPAVFTGTNSGGLARAGAVKADKDGNIVITPFLNSLIALADPSAGTLLAVSASFGGSGVRIPAFTSAGVLTNSVTTGQLNSVTTLPSGLTAPAFTVTGSFTATGLVTNAALANPATTVNGQTCTLGAPCTVTAAATGVTVGTTTVGGGTTTRVLFDNAGVLGEYSISGTGNVAMTTSPTFVTPNLGTPASGVATNLTGTASGLTAGNVTTNANLTGDVTSVGNATTLTNAPVIAKLLTGYASAAGTVSAADSILSAFQKINGNDALKAPIASPTFTGAPAAPTAAVDTNTTQIATTAMVLGQAASATPLIDGTAAVGTSTRYARGDHVHPTDTTRAPLVSPSFTTPSLGVATATSINGAVIDNTGWTSYTPTITAQTGTPTTVSAAGSYKQIGKTVFINALVTITSVGTATGAVIASLPFTSATGVTFVGTSFEQSSTGKSGAAYIFSGGAVANAKQADASTWWVNGYTLAISATYSVP